MGKSAWYEVLEQEEERGTQEPWIQILPVSSMSFMAVESVTEIAAEVLPFYLEKLVRPGILNRPLWLGCSPLTLLPVSTLDQTAPGDLPSRFIS